MNIDRSKLDSGNNIQEYLAKARWRSASRSQQLDVKIVCGALRWRRIARDLLMMRSGGVSARPDDGVSMLRPPVFRWTTRFDFRDGH